MNPDQSVKQKQAELASILKMIATTKNELA